MYRRCTSYALIVPYNLQRPVVWMGGGGGVRVRNVTLRTAGGGWGPQRYVKFEDESFKGRVIQINLVHKVQVDEI
jgi:hypothetical protein